MAKKQQMELSIILEIKQTEEVVNGETVIKNRIVFKSNNNIGCNDGKLAEQEARGFELLFNGKVVHNCRDIVKAFGDTSMNDEFDKAIIS